MGIGSSMSGSLIFLIYSSADGKNVTVSPRLGRYCYIPPPFCASRTIAAALLIPMALARGHQEPGFDSSIQLEVLDGTGVAGGIMTANFRCQ